jgi:hypothetical protein
MDIEVIWVRWQAKFRYFRNWLRGLRVVFPATRQDFGEPTDLPGQAKLAPCRGRHASFDHFVGAGESSDSSLPSLAIRTDNVIVQNRRRDLVDEDHDLSVFEGRRATLPVAGYPSLISRFGDRFLHLFWSAAANCIGPSLTVSLSILPSNAHHRQCLGMDLRLASNGDEVGELT